MNSISQPPHHELRAVRGRIADDPEARAVVLTGAGTAFCSGGDVENFVRNLTNVEHRRRSLRGARKLVDEILDFPLPVVAALSRTAWALAVDLPKPAWTRSRSRVAPPFHNDKPLAASASATRVASGYDDIARPPM